VSGRQADLDALPSQITGGSLIMKPGADAGLHEITRHIGAQLDVGHTERVRSAGHAAIRAKRSAAPEHAVGQASTFRSVIRHADLEGGQSDVDTAKETRGG
jgi:hypothetical protein